MRPSLASESLLDASGGSPGAASARWIEALFLGQLGVILAIIAVAVTGLLFLTGRLAWRSAARVVLGCAILFGAPAIVAGLMGSVEEGGGNSVPSVLGQQEPAFREDLQPARERSGASLRRD